MVNINKAKAFSLFIVVVVTISCLIMIKPAYSQTIPQPSVPEFTIKIAEHSYDVPPTYGIDQFTGQNITIQEGTHYQWKTLDFTIVNQKGPNGYSLYYNIRYKGQYTTNWTELFHAGTYIVAQSGQYSTVSFLLSGSYPSSIFGDIYRLIIPADAPVDFQVEALIGTTTRGSIQFGSGDTFSGESSGWSNTHTLNVSDGSTTTNSGITPSSSPNSQQTGNFDWEQIVIILLVITVVVLAFALVLSHRRNAKHTSLPPNA
jgi:heme/copper-type cytochrome/quinol oxidase subunit 2